MASPRTTIVLLASLLGVSSCRQKENKPDASLSEQRETPGQSSASSAPLAVVNPVPPDTVVALAVDTGMGRLEIRTGFIFSPPISTKSGKNVAVTLLPEGAKAHRFGYVWSPDGRLWSQCQLANQDGNLVFFSMPKGSPAPALPVENASTKPDQPGFSARLSSVAIDGAAAPAETDQLNEENLALLLQIQALEKTKAGTPPPNQDRNQWIQEQRKLTDQRRALDIRLEAIRARAGQLGIQLPTKAMEPLPAPSRPPRIRRHRQGFFLHIPKGHSYLRTRRRRRVRRHAVLPD